MNQLNYILMAPAGGEGGGGSSMLIMMLLLIVVFWFFFIRPQMRKNKELQKFRQNLAKGQKIITIGGIHGKIIEMGDTTVTIETEGQGRLKIEKSAVATEFNPEQIAQK
jgi:preprotein translocase subunit YajC